MKALPIIFKLSVLFCLFFLNTQFANAQKDVTGEVITASVDCNSLGELNGEVMYQYDVTLRNNTNSQFTVDYTVYFKSGSTIIKSHSHSDILTPGEELVNSNEGTMSASEWGQVSLCVVEWSTRD